MVTCKCGRSIEKPHCPHCGTTTIYALKSKFFLDDKAVVVKVFQCRKCGEQFNDIERAACTAPPPSLTKQQQREAEALAKLQKSGGTEYFQNEKEKRLKILENIFKGES